MHAYDESLTEDYTVKVILPEGATQITIELPTALQNNVDSIEMGKFFGTLDYFGRPMITIRQSNAVHDLCDDIIRVKYRFNTSRDLYLEPIQLFGILFTIYITAMIYMRTSLSLENKENKAKKE